jgi:D-amino-acid dehydrogenase
MSQAQRDDVLIIGAGIIGVSTAYELARRGARVTVIDRGEPGMGCSYGNAGWLTPCFSMPLPMPGMLIKSIGWLLDPMSPLHIQPRPSPLLARWLTRFLLAMNRRQMLRSVHALTEISKYSLDRYAELEAELGQPFGFERKGLLMVAQSDAGVKAALQEMELVADHGVPGRQLDVDAIRAMEPALTGTLRGGVYFPEEAHCEPLAIVRALAEGAKRHGARFVKGAEAFDFVSEGRELRAVRTTAGDFSADRYVLATGTWSTGIARRLRLNVPILGGKGYALICRNLPVKPRVSIMLLEKKVAVTPRQDSVRLAGTLELVNMDFSISPGRVAAIEAGAREFLAMPQKLEVSEVWRGLRPCTPDGVPLIGPAPGWSNLHLNCGHQMLGLQSAAGSARLAADLLLGKPAAFDPYPFRAERF